MEQLRWALAGKLELVVVEVGCTEAWLACIEAWQLLGEVRKPVWVATEVACTGAWVHWDGTGASAVVVVVVALACIEAWACKREVVGEACKRALVGVVSSVGEEACTRDAWVLVVAACTMGVVVAVGCSLGLEEEQLIQVEH